MFIIEKQRENTVLPCKKPVIRKRQKISRKTVDIRTKPIYNRYIIKMSKDTQSRKIKEFFGSEIRIIALKGDKSFIIFLQKVPKTAFLSGF